MTQQSPLFRPEAVEHVRRGERGGDVIRIGPRWTARAFWTLLAIAAAAIVFGVLSEVATYRHAPAVATPDGTVRAVVQMADAPRKGARVDFALTETGDRTAMTVMEVGAAQPGAATVTARANGDRPPQGPGVLEIKTGERRLIEVLIPGSGS